MPPTLVMLASEQSGDGHSQCAKPFTSTQEAPNSQLISSQDLGADGSGGGREGGKGDKKRVPTLKQTDKQSQEAMLDPTPSPFPGTRQSSTSVPTCPQHLCPHVSPWAVAPTPFSQPVMPSLLPLGHWLHFMPVIPVLQEHSPVICSQSSRTEPTGSQLQAGQGGGKRKKVMLGGWQPSVLQKKRGEGCGENHDAGCDPVLTLPKSLDLKAPGTSERGVRSGSLVSSTGTKLPACF